MQKHHRKQDKKSRIYQFITPLPYEITRKLLKGVNKKYVKSRFATIRGSTTAHANGISMGIAFFIARLIELCIKMGPVITGSKLDMLVRWDRYSVEEALSHLEKEVGKEHPLEFLIAEGHLKRLRNLLDVQDLDFLSLEEEIRSILGQFLAPVKGDPKQVSRDWASIRIAIHRICKRWNDRFSPCFDEVVIGPSNKASKASPASAASAADPLSSESRFSRPRQVAADRGR